MYLMCAAMYLMCAIMHLMYAVSFSAACTVIFNIYMQSSFSTACTIAFKSLLLTFCFNMLCGRRCSPSIIGRIGDQDQVMSHMTLRVSPPPAGKRIRGQ